MVLAIFLFIGKAYYDTNSIEIRHYQIESKTLGNILKGKRLAFLTDLHIKNLGKKEIKLLEVLNKEKPDLVFLGGDYINYRGSYQPAIEFMGKIQPPLGFYGVLGNTEYSNENGSCVLCHHKNSKALKTTSHQVFLRNSSVELKINGKVLNLVGLDDPVNDKADLNLALSKRDPKAPVLLISHSPKVFEEAVQKGVNFILSGHNHGGQIFILKYLRNFIPLDPDLEFLDGFFQKGKTLLYVSRGIGTSLLPFRLGVKPEITFFTFSNEDKLLSDTYNIKNNSLKTIFLGLNLNSLLDIFRLNLFFTNSKILDSSCITSSGHILFDFESDKEFNRLNWECKKWFERSTDYATSGKFSLKVYLPPGPYPGIDFKDIRKDWSKSKYLKMDVVNPANEEFTFHIRIDDHKSGWEYADRYDKNFLLKKGKNEITLPLALVRTNIGSRPLDLRNIKKLMVFIPNNQKKREIYIDKIRLE